MKKLAMLVGVLLVSLILIIGTLVYWFGLYILISAHWYQILFCAGIPMISSFIIAGVFYHLAKEDNKRSDNISREQERIIKAYGNRILTFLDCMNKKEKGVSIEPSKTGEVQTIVKTVSVTGKINVSALAKGTVD